MREPSCPPLNLQMGERMGVRVAVGERSACSKAGPRGPVEHAEVRMLGRVAKDT